MQKAPVVSVDGAALEVTLQVTPSRQKFADLQLETVLHKRGGKYAVHAWAAQIMRSLEHQRHDDASRLLQMKQEKKVKRVSESVVCLALSILTVAVGRQSRRRQGHRMRWQRCSLVPKVERDPADQDTNDGKASGAPPLRTTTTTTTTTTTAAAPSSLPALPSLPPSVPTVRNDRSVVAGYGATHDGPR